jgi:hypothetical protein
LYNQFDPSKTTSTELPSIAIGGGSVIWSSHSVRGTLTLTLESRTITSDRRIVIVNLFEVPTTVTERRSVTERPVPLHRVTELALTWTPDVVTSHQMDVIVPLGFAAVFAI